MWTGAPHATAAAGPKLKVGIDDGTRPLSICICGDGAVGKTSILHRYMDDEFTTDYEPTLFEDYAGCANVDGHMISIQLRDTAGQEAFDSINQASYVGVDCCVLVFSLETTRFGTTLGNILKKWAPDIKMASPDTTFILAGSKRDLDPVDFSSGESRDAIDSAMKSIGATEFIATSAKLTDAEGGNCYQLIEAAVRSCMFE